MAQLIKKKAFVLAALGVLLVVSAYFALQNVALPASKANFPGKVLVIDPGHGGVDGGAISIDGSRESDINLSIGNKLNALAQLFGIDTLMTRSSDKSSADMAQYSEHRDLVYRTELANSQENAILISIHQNCYPTSQPSGSQVMHADDEQSKTLAWLIQGNLTSCLDPENRRLAEPAPKRLYITSNAKCPAVLVECGFMSNFSDIEKLKDDNYQSSVALVLLASYLQFMQGIPA